VNTSTRFALLVCGSRNWTEEEPIRNRLKAYPPGTILIHGDCGHYDEKTSTLFGADRIAALIGKTELGHDPLPMPAPWNRKGRKAGPIRNRLMTEVLARLRWCGYQTAVEAFPLPSSSGTWITVNLSRKLNFRVTITEL